uniref:MalT-like TPR region domain-containing protein n=1 Tax=Phytophthora ramorum TaxID=164328 RepID=H3HAY5_PHYRM
MARSPAHSPPKSPLNRSLDAFINSNVTTVNAREGTQLAEATPQVDLPQRIDAPESIKTPERDFPPSREERIQKTVFSPHATALRKLKTHIRSTFENGAEVESKLTCCSSQKLKDRGRAVSSKLIKEYSMLAESSKRAGRHDAECTAYLCLGILHDNVEDYSKAIDSYLLVLSISESTQNNLFTGLAANCIGVNYQLLSSSTKDYSYTGKFVDPQSRSLQNALVYHQKHLEVADDAGKFVAHLNLGLTLEYEKAERAFDQAHRLAQELGDGGAVKQCGCYLGVARARLQMKAS